MQRPLGGFHQDLYKILSQSIVKDLRLKDIQKIFMPGPRKEYNKIVKKGPWTGSDKIFIEEPPDTIPEELSHKHP